MDNQKKPTEGQTEFKLSEHPWETDTMGTREEVESLIRDTVYDRIASHRPKMLLFRRIAAAAVLLLSVSAGLYFLSPAANQQELARLKAPKNTLSDIMPGGNKAVLTLADGSKIDLEAMEKGLSKNGSTAVNKIRDGQVSFFSAGGSSQTVESLNTLVTPRGGKYSIILPDGTKVWLNAASSLRFPATFSATERKVYLSGEGYFEVAKDKHKPFRVYIDDLEINVLGTHFNVMGYADEKEIKTTLLEGSVNISDGRSSSLLKPGQEGNLSKTGSLEVKKANISQAMAWKQDQFIFDKVDIQTIMRELSRWYNVDVQYQGEIPKNEFVGKISRNATLAQVIRVLELSHVHLRIEDKTIVIRP
jgi:ferric-dicitrate binding protein FerR (iron transport regulator)